MKGAPVVVTVVTSMKWFSVRSLFCRAWLRSAPLHLAPLVECRSFNIVPEHRGIRTCHVLGIRGHSRFIPCAARRRGCTAGLVSADEVSVYWLVVDSRRNSKNAPRSVSRDARQLGVSWCLE